MSAYVKIGSTGGPSSDGVVSDWLKRFDIWFEDYAIGTWAVVLDDVGNRFWDETAPQDVAIIKVATTTIMEGFVDDPLYSGLPKSVIHPERVRITGRNYGQDLANKMFTSDEYLDGDTRIDDMIDEVLAAVSSNIIYSSPHTAPKKPYGWDRTMLLDGLNDLCQMVDYLHYVTPSGGNGVLMLKPLSALVSTGVTLKSVADAQDNNILHINPIGHGRGYGIRNYIHVKGSLINDHYTEGNVDDYTAVSGALSNETTVVLAGKACIKSHLDSIGPHQFYLDFPRYSHDTLDFSALSEEQGKFLCQINYVPEPPQTVDVQLKFYDDEDPQNVIAFVSMEFATDQWEQRIFPVGVNVEISEASTQPSGPEWWYIDKQSTFSWKIKKIEVLTGDTDDIYFDGLALPINALSIRQDSPSQSAYVKRDLPLSRFDIKSQIELDAYAESMLAKHKDPLHDLKVWAVGNTGLLYNATTTIVNAPSRGLSNVTYRIAKLHHMYGDDVWPGFKHVTELNLIKQTI